MNNENLNQETIVEVNGSEKKYNFVYGVSFKKALQTYFFGFDEENLNIHDKVVVETVRGLELGTIKIGARPASEIKLATAIKPILRVANEEDINNYTKNLEQDNDCLNENEIAGFDSSTYQDANKETESGTHATAHGETITTSGQESGSESVAHGEVITKAEQSSGSEALAHGHKIETESEGTEETETTRASHIHGNIGVTTSQQMIEAELALADKFWIYDYIASAFETDNFITVYNSYYDSI